MARPGSDNQRFRQLGPLWGLCPAGHRRDRPHRPGPELHRRRGRDPGRHRDGQLPLAREV